MPTYEELEKQIEALFSTATEPEQLEGLGAVKAKISELKSEHDALTEKYGNLYGKYKEAVINAPLPPKGTPEETGGAGDREISLDEAFQAALKPKN